MIQENLDCFDHLFFVKITFFMFIRERGKNKVCPVLTVHFASCTL